MIKVKNATGLSPAVPAETETSRFEHIRKVAAERHKKSDTDGTRRRDRQTAEDNRLV